jgi:hypothetical protein
MSIATPQQRADEREPWYLSSVRTTKTMGMCYFPYEMMEPLLGTDLMARQVFELIVPVLVDAGLKATYGDLINFLTIALVEPSLTRKDPWTLQPQAGKSGYVHGPMATGYRGEHVLYRDLPGLRPGSTAPTTSTPALVNVYCGMQDTVANARAERNDRLDNREEARRSRATDRLMLLCQASDDDPPHTYTMSGRLVPEVCLNIMSFNRQWEPLVLS